MKKAYFPFLLLLLLAGNRLLAGAPEDFSRHFKLLPQPQKIEVLSGKGIGYTSLRGIQLKGTARKPILTGLLEALPLATSSDKGLLILEIAPDRNIPSEEGYVMQVQNGDVRITAKGQAGLFYGCQTLQQLLEDARDQAIPIPPVRITDYPELAYRGVHIDVKHHLDVGNYYYQVDSNARSHEGKQVFDYLRSAGIRLIGSPAPR